MSNKSLVEKLFFCINTSNLSKFGRQDSFPSHPLAVSHSIIFFSLRLPCSVFALINNQTVAHKKRVIIVGSEPVFALFHFHTIWIDQMNKPKSVLPYGFVALDCLRRQKGLLNIFNILPHWGGQLDKPRSQCLTKSTKICCSGVSFSHFAAACRA